MADLAELTRPYAIEVTREAAEKFTLYREMLLNWNEKMNLTAITDSDEIDEKHFLDSLMLLKAWGLPMGAKVIDVGTGAGFPGIPIKIVRPDVKLALLDSLRKRTLFLRELSSALGQENEIIHARAEDAARDPKLRESFHLATARAVAAMPVLCELCLPFVRVGGAFLAPKGSASDVELEAARSAIFALGGITADAYQYTLPVSGERVIHVVQKSSQTPTCYPRRYAQITKTPI